ncbi:MAG: MarR family transcriptional regulator [Spirochaetaceae bacterium]|nr:MAG: MarR family transcriptional regulator [Spirochaetaceae bacterium]
MRSRIIDSVPRLRYFWIVTTQETIEALPPEALFAQLGIVPQVCPASNLGKAYKSVARVFEDCFKDAVITTIQFSVLVHIQVLDKPGCSDLATHLGSDPSTVSRIIETLVKKKLVNSRCGADRRTREYCLTPAGVEAVQAGLEAWSIAHRRIMERIGVERWNQLLALLQFLND